MQNSDMENVYFHIVKRVCNTTLRRILLRKEIRRTNQESQFMFENICIEIWSIYEIMLKNEVVRDTKK